jgi:GTP-binding protein HflX
VLDRTMLILEIFAARAMSGEGKLQVELARDRYLLPRLSGLGSSLSRLGGGGGGAGAGARRGKGETRLELDRRRIRRRIQLLERGLKDLTLRRDEMRRRRKKDGIVTVAIVGYTNVGKSTLLNALTDAGVLVEDKLFATLDPTARALKLPDGRSVMLIDTVGLIRRLPHHLVEAFKSTLEEAVHASLLLNVCDVSSEDAAAQIEVTRETLEALGVTETPVLTVLNKCDKLEELPRLMGRNTCLISAKTGFGFEELLLKIAELLTPSQKHMKLMIPYGKDALLAEIRREGKILSQEYAENGTLVTALVDNRIIYKATGFSV